MFEWDMKTALEVREEEGREEGREEGFEKGREDEREKWIPIVAEKDAEIARLKAQLAAQHVYGSIRLYGAGL